MDSGLSTRMAVSARLVPLISEEQGIGAMLPCAKDIDVTSETPSRSRGPWAISWSSLWL
jgi:hypothetical protein